MYLFCCFTSWQQDKKLCTLSQWIILHMIQRCLWYRFMNMALDQILTPAVREKSQDKWSHMIQEVAWSFWSLEFNKLIYIIRNTGCPKKLCAFYLWCVNDLPQRPHQSSVDPHELLGADLVRFVQHDSHLVLMVFEGSDHLWKLVWDVQLVSVKEEDDAVHSLCKPLQHCSKVITWGQKERKRGDSV